MTRYENYRRFREAAARCKNDQCSNAAAFGHRGLCNHCYSNKRIRQLYPRASPGSNKREETVAELDALITARLAEPLPPYWLSEGRKEGEYCLPSTAYRACAYVLEHRPDAKIKRSLVESVAGDRFSVWDGSEQLTKWLGDVGDAWRAAYRRLSGKSFKDDTKPAAEGKSKQVTRGRRR